jgi:hypothetical protein
MQDDLVAEEPSSEREDHGVQESRTSGRCDVQAAPRRSTVPNQGSETLAVPNQPTHVITSTASSACRGVHHDDVTDRSEPLAHRCCHHGCAVDRRGQRTDDDDCGTLGRTLHSHHGRDPTCESPPSLSSSKR